MHKGTGGEAISSQRAHPDRDENNGYTFERLEAAVAELITSRRQLQAENATLREQLLDQAQRLQGTDERLREANQRRQDVLKRIDDLIASLDQIDSQFAAGRSSGSAGASNPTN